MILQMICPSMAVAMDVKFTGNGSGHPESRNGLNRCVLEIVGFPGLFSPTCFGHVTHIRHHLGQAIETFGEPQRRTPRSKAGDTNMKIHLDSLNMSSWMPHPGCVPFHYPFVQLGIAVVLQVPTELTHGNWLAIQCVEK